MMKNAVILWNFENIILIYISLNVDDLLFVFWTRGN